MRKNIPHDMETWRNTMNFPVSEKYRFLDNATNDVGTRLYEVQKNP